MDSQQLRMSRNNYNQLLYAEWNQLPPNLPLPGTPQVNSFQLTFHSLIYLQQSKVQTPLHLSLEWWGMKQPHLMVFDTVNSLEKTAKYIICSPIQGLLSYFTDTKVLSIDFNSGNRNVGKAYLNFLVLKGWKGQRFEGYIDIKSNKKKIGELTYSMQIVKTSNPFLNIEPKKERSRNNSMSKEERQGGRHESIHKSRFNTQQVSDNNRIMEENNNIQHHRRSSEQNQSLKAPNLPLYQRNTTEEREIKMLDQYQQQQEVYQHIYEQHNLNQYQTELVRLAEDYNLLFQKKDLLNDIRHESQNMIDLQIVKVELNTEERPQQIEVSLPLMNSQINEYKINVRGFVKVCIDSTNNRQQLLQYLKNCDVQFKCMGKYYGSIKLSKILSKNGQIIEVLLMHRDKKEGKVRQKGIIYIKAIPPQQQPEKEVEVQQQKEYKKEIETPIFYALLYIKRYNPVENIGRKINLFIKICEQNGTQVLGQTKTLWNGQNDFNLNDNVTCQTRKNALILHLFDRQKNDIKLGQGLIHIEHPIGINLQVPIATAYLGKKLVVGYITLDYVKNGLNSVTKMINVFNQTGANPAPIHTQAQAIQYSQQQSLQHDISSIESTEKQHSHRDDIELPKQIQTAVKYFAETQIESTQKKHKEVIFQRNLSQLQICSKLFTYLHQNPILMAPLDELNSVKITQLLNILEPITKKNVITYKQLNLLISKHIFNTQQTNFVNKFNVAQFRDSYEAFSTYYEQLVQERDSILKQFLSILDKVGISINDLEYQLKSNKNIWNKINNFLSFSKGQNINIVQAIRDHYQHSKIQTKNVSGSEFCDILRRFEVYETTIGEQVRPGKMSALIYEHLCQVLVSIEPEIMTYTYREILNLLQEEQIMLSQWELINLEQHLRAQGRLGKMIRKNDFEHQSRQTKPVKQHQEEKKQNINGLDNKPTITKSPTFGYLHAPELYKPVLENEQDQHMVESLANNIRQLPISPINHQSSQENTKHQRVVLTHLKYFLTAIRIDSQPINLSQIPIANYFSHSQPSNQRISAKQYESNKQSLPDQEHPYQDISKTIKSVDQPSQKQYYSHKSSNQSRNIEFSLSQLDRKFSYRVQICFEEEPDPIVLECLHEEWCSIVSDEGQYLGGLLIC